MPVANRPILSWSIDYLNSYGSTEIIVNAHHHHEQVVDYLHRYTTSGVRTHTRVEPEILGTGGGIKNVEDFWDRKPFVVMNADVLTDIDLQSVLRDHRDSGALATLVLHDCEPYNQLEVDKNLNITDIGKTASSGRLAFTGIHIIDPRVLAMIPAGVFSDIIDCYRTLIRDGKPVKAYVSRNHYWRDIGSITNYMEANRDFAGKPFLIGSGCHIHLSAKIEDWAVIGNGCRIGEGATIRRSVLWEDVEIKQGVDITDSIVNSGTAVERDLAGEIKV